MGTLYASGGGAAAADHLAASAGVAMLESGGNAVDAVIAAAAVMAVTSPHMCGLGGDLFAVVARAGAKPVALNASGRAGSGADPERLRAEGARAMPFQHDIRSVTVPGFVDGLLALHVRHAALALTELLAPAQRLAAGGFPVSSSLSTAAAGLEPATLASAFGGPLTQGRRLSAPGVARGLAAIAAAGRAGFYEGEAGAELLAVGGGEFTGEDLTAPNADWVEPLSVAAFGRLLWTAPPNSQGYLALSGAWIAERVGVPEDPAEERWPFVLVEAARQAGHDRIAALHENADGAALLSEERLGPRAAAVGEHASENLADPHAAGGTTAICTVDAEGSGVSLIMSNAAGFGSRLLLPEHGIFLHNRGMGFSLEASSPAEYGPRRRPPHTLTPLVVTDHKGRLDTVLGTMGGDAQPQVLLQLLARVLVHGEDPKDAIGAPRWVLSRDDPTGFHVWEHDGLPIVRLEDGAPAAWARGLERRGYETAQAERGEQVFGHAQLIRVTADGLCAGAADPRSGYGAFVGR
ncbi:MAG TPA: gamma-glutamyltransferase [Solirubrobacteraceae bacterium]|jgi:gamma-glutamyltranspeptidase/glutathione hydrolase|nr:gamma-glutamyltransferase [Solirubrobacteraceae bacterium]